MPRSVWFGFALTLTLALAGTAHAQGDAGRVTITPLAGYGLGYTREVAIEFAGATDRASWEVGRKAIVGLNAEMALGGRFAAAVGVLRRGKVDPRMDCQADGGVRVCVAQSPEEGALWIARAGAAWMARNGCRCTSRAARCSPTRRASEGPTASTTGVWG